MRRFGLRFYSHCRAVLGFNPALTLWALNDREKLAITLWRSCCGVKLCFGLFVIVVVILGFIPALAGVLLKYLL